MLLDPYLSPLKAYADLLIKWNKSINLVSKNTIANLWERHILDSAQLATYLNSEDHVFDLGSGAGLPGIILSIIKINNITLIESDTRKCAFLLQAANLSANKVNIINDRIENYNQPLKPDIITSRALSTINNLLSYNEVFTPKKGFLLLKGENYQKELEEAEKNWHFEVVIHPSTTNFSSSIIEINNVKAK